MMTQPNTEKLSDKAFVRFLITSIFGIFVCLICLCSSTYAWFSSDVSSNNNKITAKQCELTVTVSEIDENGKVVKELLKADLATAEESRKLVLTEGTTYSVKLELPKDSASGYLVIDTGSEKAYYSDYIERHTEENAKTIEFTLTVTGTTGTVTFVPRWGIYSDSNLCSVKDKGTLTIPITTPVVEETTQN